MLRLIILYALAPFALAAENPTPIAVSDIKREKAVDFSTEIIPVFQKNCLACHNATDAKGELVLENPASILKGGETGPAVVPGKPAESLLMKLATHQAKPIMPPKTNKADAKPLTPDELGLLHLWIAQGATGAVSVLPPVRWQELAASFNPIHACAISPDGLLAACARGNQVDIYEIATLQYAGSLVDPALGAADRDLVESLAFSPDGQLLAAGSYRNVKLWRFAPPVLGAIAAATNPPAFSAVITTNKEVQVLQADGKEHRKITVAAQAVALSPDGKRLAAVQDSIVRLVNVEDGKVLAELKGDPREQHAAARADRDLAFAKSETAFRKSAVETAEKNQKTEAEALKKVADAKAAADKALAEKAEAAKKAAEARAAAQKVLNDTVAAIAQATENRNLTLKLIEAAESAAKTTAASATEAEQIFERAKANREAAYADIFTLAAAAKADGGKAAEAHAAIDRALVIKLSFEHAQTAKSAAQAAATTATANAKTALESKARAEKAVADLTNQQKDFDGKLKAAEKQLADAETAQKQAETTVKNVATNLEGTTAVAKKADEAVVAAKKLLGDAEGTEKQFAAQVEAAKKRVADSEKKVRAAAFAGPWLLVAAEDNTIRSFNADSGRPGPVLNADAAAAALVAGANLAAPSISWKLERQIGHGSEKSPLADRVLAIDFSPDGKLLATGGGVPSRGGELKIWNVADGSLVREIKDAHSDSVFAVKFSPDQKFLASGGADKLMKAFEVESGKFVRSFEGHTHHVLNVSWMRHGRTIASAGADSAIKLWDFANGEQKKTIGGSSKEITAFQFLDSAPEALAASGDNQLRLLKEDGKNVRTFGGASDYTQSAAITPDGRYLIAGGSDSQFRVWNAEKGDLLKAFPPPARARKPLATTAAP